MRSPRAIRAAHSAVPSSPSHAEAAEAQQQHINSSAMEDAYDASGVVMGSHSPYVEYGSAAHAQAREGLIQPDGGHSDAAGNEMPPVQKPTQWKCIKLSAIIGLMALVAVGITFLLLHRSSSDPCHSADTPVCGFMCEGQLLQTVQFSGLFHDSKTFVDMPLKKNPQCIIDDFYSMEDYSQTGIYDFLMRNYNPSCSDMLLWSPPDYDPQPAFLDSIADPTLREWAADVHSLWNLLGRQLDPDVYTHPQRHTLLPLKHPHMIVPGGRFCEFYYWDSYWIILGLLVSDMQDTAREITENFLHMVESYGFIPNGSRKYYLNRSQPPLLALMVAAVYEAQGDLEWVRAALPTLEKEHAFWMQPGARALNVTDDKGKTHVLNRYYSPATRPRPESFVADEVTAWLLHNYTQADESARKSCQGMFELPEHTQHPTPEPQRKKGMRVLNLAAMKFDSLQEAKNYQSSADFEHLAHYASSTPSHSRRTQSAGPPPVPVPSFHNDSNIRCLFAEITAAAESGWDFSSRWFHDRSNLTSVETMDLIPVDLNAILYAVEQQIATFHELLDNAAKAAEWRQTAKRRQEAIHALLWNAENSQWQDYHVAREYWKAETMLSNFVPLWTKSYDPALVDEGAVVSALLQSGLVLDGGLVTTLNNNTQQWDWPNAWAPLQWMVVQGIARAEYNSHSDRDTFDIFNSTETPDQSPTPNVCDVARPESWFSCPDEKDCGWCFPGPEDLSRALGQRWLYSNFLAFNSTGYMLEKYSAARLGDPGFGGEYVLQKGFGWSNGVALAWSQAWGQDPRFSIEHMQSTPYLFAHMAGPVEPSTHRQHPPVKVSAEALSKEAAWMRQALRKEQKRMRRMQAGARDKTKSRRWPKFGT